MFKDYGPLSTAVYEITKPIGYSIDGDIEFYAKRLKNVTGSILEIGSGTGRVMIPLLQQGYKVHGVDTSWNMIQSNKRNLDQFNLDTVIFHDNAMTMALEHSYDAIIMPSGTFCLITQYESMVAMVKNIYTHLNTGGRFIFDILLPDDFIVGSSHTSFVNITENCGIVWEMKSLSMDWHTQTTHSLIKYEKWKDGELIDTELQNFPIVWYGIQEMTLLLQTIGFQDVIISTNYQFKHHANGNIITLEATK
ncbi:class I SAM-dependent methyltransferase [Erysipelothrix sp. HDW6C]|uniref:class I SAM-dependent methyltransferase n=1 Tax=Erysipelothrix sp. HDW6C TaxID=2714930 RepID=UPI00140A6B80|nr:class I SAM-dependent methyltransferase [Erysipelothrix sp. HDW6C]QIK69506.1 class I SAM-dependent methyltransferase [Erysipelothrix sp. HDW6C]